MKKPLSPVVPEADWRLIRAFVAVMRAGNLTDAARLLGTSQPTVGRQIRELELRAGEPYFLRTGNRLLPTERAVFMYDQANEVESAVTGLSRGMLSASAVQLIPVHITTSAIFGVEVMPRVLSRVDAGGTDFEVKITASDDLEDLMRRDADIAIRFIHPAQGDLIGKQVAQLDLGLFASETYLAKYGTPNNVSDLSQHLFVGNSSGADIRDGAEALGIDPTAVRLSTRSGSSMVRLAAVRAGLGIGGEIIAIAGRDGALTRILPNLTVGRLPVWLIAHPDIKRSKSLLRLFRVLRHALTAELVA